MHKVCTKHVIIKNAKSYFHCHCGILSMDLIELEAHMGIQVMFERL